MVGLKKPSICDKCGGIIFVHEFRPERWICADVGCGHIQVQRPMRNDPNKCRICAAPRGSKPFKKKGNICIDCLSNYNSQYRDTNTERLKQQHRDSYQRDKKKRQAAVRQAVQRSPEAFIRHTFGHIKSRVKHESGKKLVANGKLNSVCLDVRITFDDLWSLWEKQGGKCALTGLPMTHVFGDMCSISVDRVDSSFGYVPGNVQLVCQWVNRAKNNHTNDDLLVVLQALRKV